MVLQILHTPFDIRGCKMVCLRSCFVLVQFQRLQIIPCVVEQIVGRLLLVLKRDNGHSGITGYFL